MPSASHALRKRTLRHPRDPPPPSPKLLVVWHGRSPPSIPPNAPLVFVQSAGSSWSAHRELFRFSGSFSSCLALRIADDCNNSAMGNPMDCWCLRIACTPLFQRLLNFRHSPSASYSIPANCSANAACRINRNGRLRKAYGSRRCPPLSERRRSAGLETVPVDAQFPYL